MIRGYHITINRKRERVKNILAVGFLLAVIIAGTAGLMLENRPMEPDTVYPMTNRRIEWTGAGYSGIYGGGGR